MKYFIFDSSNDGIIWVGEDIYIGNRLKEGLLDCDLGAIGPQHDSYGSMSIPPQSHIFWDGKNSRVQPLPLTAVNPVYTTKRRLVWVRHKPMVMLFRYITWGLRKTFIFPSPSIHADISLTLEDCNPLLNEYSYGVNEYAITCGMQPHEAYKQLKLRVDNFATLQMRVYAQCDMFVHMINNCHTESDAGNVLTLMHRKFVKDNFI